MKQKEIGRGWGEQEERLKESGPGRNQLIAAMLSHLAAAPSGGGRCCAYTADPTVWQLEGVTKPALHTAVCLSQTCCGEGSGDLRTTDRSMWWNRRRHPGEALGCLLWMQAKARAFINCLVITVMKQFKRVILERTGRYWTDCWKHRPLECTWRVDFSLVRSVTPLPLSSSAKDAGMVLKWTELEA